MRDLFLTLFLFFYVGCSTPEYQGPEDTTTDSNICTGEQGLQGLKGDQGKTGPQGLPGEQGQQGPQGGQDLSSAPMPHWVLRDNAGEAMKASVWPRQDEGYTRFQHTSTCVNIHFFEDSRPIDIVYDVVTGEIEPCLLNTYTTTRHLPNSFFLEAGCAGDVYYQSAYGIYAQVGDELIYSSGPSVLSKTYFKWNSVDDVCEMSLLIKDMAFYKFKPVPYWVLNLLQDAPYTLSMEY